MIETLLIFTDASFDPVSKLAVCGYTLVNAKDWENTADKGSFPVALEVCENLRSIAAAELESLTMALQHIEHHPEAKICIYADSPAITRLLERQDHLEQTNFISGRTGEPLNHASAYRELLWLMKDRDVTITAMKGHTKLAERSDFDHAFATVDQATRQRLREELKSFEADPQR